MVKAKTLTQNTAFYTGALVFQKVLAFVYFTFLARGLGVEDIGRYTFAFSFTTIFSVFVDVGLASVLVREVAKQKEKAQKLLSDILGIKLGLAVITYIFVVALVNLLNYPELTKNLVYITGLIMVLDNFSTTFWAPLRGNQNLKYESLGVVVFESSVVVIGLALLYLGLGVFEITLATLVGSTILCIYAWKQAQKRLGLKFKPMINWKLTGKLIKMSIPFALTGIFARLNTQLDTVLLSKIGCLGNMCEENVGIYSVASKITLAIHFIPLAFTAALLPKFSEDFVNDKEKLKQTFEKSMKYLMMVGLPMAAGIFALSPAFVPQVFGAEFKNSVLPLQILMASLVFMFLTFPIGSLLNAVGRQLRNSMHIGVAVVINAILNIVLIPKYSYVGASIASLISTFVILILGIYVIPQIIKNISLKNTLNILITFLKTLVASSLMGFVVYILLDYIHFIILILIGALSYVCLALVLKIISQEEIKNIIRSLKLVKTKK